MVTVFIYVKISGDKTKVSKETKFFDFLGTEGSTIEEKSKKFIDRIKLKENNNNNKQ